MVGMVGVLPLVAPVMDFTAAVSDGEPPPGPRRSGRGRGRR